MAHTETDNITNIRIPEPIGALDFVVEPISGSLSITLNTNLYTWDDALTVDVDTSLTFTADASFPVHLYEWDFGDGERGYGPSIAHTYGFPSNHGKVTLYATDEFGKVHSTTHRIYVS